jgi:putative ABC transport system permease protein
MAPAADVRVVLNGRVESFRITGVALSSEYVYAVKSGLPIPEDRYFAVLWIDRTAAEAAFGMEGAFNDALVAVAPGANLSSVIDELDRVLEPYGSIGAIARRDQSSNRFLEDELNQQKVMSTTVPYIFFGVAAFLLNIVIGRLVAAQREQIAALKALGMATSPIVLHYMKLVAVIVAIGSALGVAAGFGFGQAMIYTYRGFFRFPALDFVFTPWSALAGAGISLVAGMLGVLAALRNVMTVAPATAMQPAAPHVFRHSIVERMLSGKNRNARRMLVLRNMLGRPWRSGFTILGVALAVPMVVLGLFWGDALDFMVDLQFTLVERGNANVTFPSPRDARIVGDLAREPGVIAAEGQRIVPARLRAGHRTYLTSVIGLAPDAELRRPRDAMLRPIQPPPDGIALSRRLAERLDVSTGDSITVELLEGSHRKVGVPVASIVDEVIGMSAYMAIGTLNRQTGEEGTVSTVALFIEPSAIEAVARRFKELPVIESVAMKSFTVNAFLEKIATMVLVSAAILTGFAVIIAAGVVYNSARITFQERGWELASLRVLGFTRSEVSGILFGEFIIEVAVGIPIGLLLARFVVDLLARFHSNESFQIPAVIGARTFTAAAVTVIAAAGVSMYLVRRRIDRMNLVSVLKTRE